MHLAPFWQDVVDLDVSVKWRSNALAKTIDPYQLA